MSNHQFKDGQLVEYIGDTLAESDSIATVLEYVSDNSYRVQIKETEEQGVVDESELQEL